MLYAAVVIPPNSGNRDGPAWPSPMDCFEGAIVTSLRPFESLREHPYFRMHSWSFAFAWLTPVGEFDAFEDVIQLVQDGLVMDYMCNVSYVVVGGSNRGVVESDRNLASVSADRFLVGSADHPMRDSSVSELLLNNIQRGKGFLCSLSTS